MSLAAGSRLGPYEILGLIGAGGMGEVYKARDTRLDRTVAIKVLPTELSADPDRRARFEREAKTIAALTHPHICTLHDVGDRAGSMFLVMEHLAGETLAHRLEKGPLPIEQVVDLATQIADALSAAHRQGVIHRDLKPGNVMLTRTGIKLLDFGLAKLTGHGDQPAVQDGLSAATRSMPLTAEGTIAGTLQYMAPEQVEGKPADARTDIWAFGAIVYEMLTGKRAFEGTSAASLVGAILEREPAPLATLQPLTPPAIDRLIRQCLAKAPDDRPDTAHDLANELRWMRTASGVDAIAGDRTASRRRIVRAASLMAAGAVVSAALTSIVLLRWPGPSSAGSIVRSELSVRPAAELNAGGQLAGGGRWLPTPGGSRRALAFTPDGRALVFVGRRDGVQQLYVREMHEEHARALPGTEDAQAPAVSPDGQWIAFWAPAAIKKIALAGGPVTDLVPNMEAPPSALSWDDQGGVIFGQAFGGLQRASAAGTPTTLTTLAETERWHVPSFVLPDGNGVLYTARKRLWTWGDEEVVALEPATGERKVLLRDAADAHYVPTGHLIFLRRGLLFAVPFDAKRLEMLDSPSAVIDGVAQSLVGSLSDDLTGAGQFTISGNGTLAWIPGDVPEFEGRTVVAVSRRGEISTPLAPMRAYAPRVRESPDGGRLVVSIHSVTEVGVWTYDLARGALTPIYRRGEASWPLWSPDGQHVVFESLDEGRLSIARHATSGGALEVLARRRFLPSSWTPRGELIGVLDIRDVATATIEQGTARLEPLLGSPETELWPEMSPDGRWLAYGSNASGRFDIYVQPYPGRGPRTLVSLDGGRSPAWHPGGRELLYVTPVSASAKGRMMSVPFEPGTPPRIGAPRLLFEFDNSLSFSCVRVRCFDVSRDGERFYVVQTPVRQRPPVVTHINLVQNWFADLNSKVSSRPR